MIKSRLDEYVIGQDHVKRAIATALRARYRKRIMDNPTDIRSHHLLIQGKSGSGKTELIRQTAKICNSPFIKVDAVRYTEVGYLGDDVENIISNLYNKTYKEFEASFESMFWSLETVKSAWEQFVLGFLLGKNYLASTQYEFYRDKLHKGELDNVELNLWYYDLDKVEKFPIKDIKDYFFRTTKGKIENRLPLENIIKTNIEQRGIICIDEFDKLIRNVLQIKLEK